MYLLNPQAKGYDLRAQDIKTLTYPLYMTTGEFL